MTIGRALFDLVAATVCVGCGEASDGELCESCAGEVTVCGPAVCGRCGGPPRPSASAPCPCDDLRGFDRARSLVVFAEPARSLTLALKRRARTATVNAAGALLARLALAHELMSQGRVVTNVPAGTAARRRGFDHGALLAKATARALGVPCRTLLVRTPNHMNGPRQSDVPMIERRQNVRDRFMVKPAKPVDADVLLVDDVYTTGATAEACALALKKGGARRVDVVTLARTLRRYPR